MMTTTNTILRTAIIETGLRGGRSATVAELTGYLRRAKVRGTYRDAVQRELEAMLEEGLVERERFGWSRTWSWHLAGGVYCDHKALKCDPCGVCLVCNPEQTWK